MKNANLVLLVAPSCMMIMSCCGNGKQAAGSNKEENPTNDTTSELVDASTGATQLGWYYNVKNLDITLDEGRAKVVEFLGASGIFYISTVEENKPRVRPIGIFTDFDGKVWFHVGKQKGVFSQIQKNPNVEIVAMHDALWIRISGEAVIEDNDEVYQMVLKKTPSIPNMYNEKTGLELGSFYLKNGVAEISIGNDIERFKF